MRRFPLFNVLTILVTLVIFVAFLSFSRSGASLLTWLGSWIGLTQISSVDKQIILWIKLPEMLTAWLVGAGLGIVGCAMQGLLRNPLADPAILGVSSGASFFGILLILFLSTVGLVSANFMMFLFIAASFVGASVVMLILYLFTRITQDGRVISVLLAGVALSALFGALSMLLVSFSGDIQMRQAIMWSVGGLVNTSWASVGFVAVIVFVGFWILVRSASELNIISLGEESAKTMGVCVGALLLRLLVASGVIVAAVTAVAGPIGFVGLIAPHVARMLRGAEHKGLMPSSALVGGIIMMTAIYCSKEIAYPYTISVGIIMALLGAPFFLWLLWKNYRKERLT